MSTENVITFHSSYIPNVDSGTYTVTARQQVSTNNKMSNINQDDSETPVPVYPKLFESKETKFVVGGPKFVLEPQMIHHVYPAAGLHGDFMADLPSIIFNRISLPWERLAERANTSGDRWLVLFMVDETEKTKLTEGVKPAFDLFGPMVGERYRNTFVNFLKIPTDMVERLMPGEGECNLSYCQTFRGEGYIAENEVNKDVKEDSDKSVLLGNRLPKPGSTNTVYLLSLEHCKTEANDSRSYSYLHKWEFYCNDAYSYLIPGGAKLTNGELFPEKLTGILFESSEEFDSHVSEAQLNEVTTKLIQSERAKYRIKSGSFHGLLHHLPGKLGSFNYPTSTANNNNILPPELRPFVEQGGVFLKENENYRGYRGPLQAAPVSKKPLDDILNLVSQDKNNSSGTNGFDYSYHVAYQFGILTALQDEAFHNAFYAWKHEVSAAFLTELNHNRPQRPVSHISQPNRKLSKYKPLPAVVLEKVEGWKMLRGIPFSYLIPSTKMLPIESIRHFCIDCNWINAFLLGAFSVGHVYSSMESKLITCYAGNKLFLDVNRFGFFIHSLAVGGWQDYEVDAFGQNQNSLNRLERKKISRNMELFLYDKGIDNDGRIGKLSFHLPAGKTHSGFRLENERFEKQFRKPGDLQDTNIPVKFRNEQDRIINVNELIADAKGKETSAYFGMMMIEGTPRVEFDLTKISK